MALSTIRLYNQDRKVFESVNEPSVSEEDSARFKGRLPAEVNFPVVKSLQTYWVSAACITGRLAVTLTYETAPETRYEVSPGRPLLIETQPEEDDRLTGISLSPVPGTDEVDVDFLLYPGRAIPPPPDEPFLVLSAAAGLTLEDDETTVAAWRDARPTATTALFGPQGLQDVKLILNETDFNGLPVLRFNGEGRLDSTDLASLWDFLATGPFTVAVVGRFADNGKSKPIVSTNAGASGSFTLLVDGGQQPYHTVQDDSGTTVQELLQPYELTSNIDDDTRSEPISMVWRYNDTDTMQTFCQGRGMRSETDGLPRATSSGGTLKVGGATFGSPTFMEGDIAEIRIWNRRLTDDEAAEYERFAAETYGVRGPGEPAPQPYDSPDTLDKQKLVLKAVRGLTLNSDTVEQWLDTRSSATAAAFVQDGGSALPTIDNVSGKAAVKFNPGYMVSSDPSTFWDFLGGAVGQGATVLVVARYDNDSITGTLAIWGTSGSGGSGPSLAVAADNLQTRNYKAATNLYVAELNYSVVGRDTLVMMSSMSNPINAGGTCWIWGATSFETVAGSDTAPATVTETLALGGFFPGGATAPARMRILEVRVIEDYAANVNDEAAFIEYVKERYGEIQE